MKSMGDKIIEINNLYKSFGENKAVNGISFHLNQGELFSFLGVNGAGKSTTINIIVGVLKKDSGECFVDGYSIEKSEKILPEIGIVFQNSVLDKKLSVLDNLKYRAYLYGMNKTEFKKRLEFFSKKLDLENLLKRPLGLLSGGQKRKIDITRALLHKPKILILDEPTTGLDPQTRKNVWKLIDELRKNEKLTVLLTTHYMEEASISDYVVIIDKGVIVAEGKPSDLKTKFAYDYLKIYKYNEDLKGLLIKNNIKYSLESNCLEIKFQSTNEAKDFVSDYKDYIYDLEIIKGTMDDVFLNATGRELNNL